MTASSSSRSPACLPTLSLVGPQLRIDDINEAAVDALQLQDADRFSASEWLQVDDNDGDAHAILDRLVQDSKAYRWGQNEPPILKYRVGPSRTTAAAEVLASVCKNQSGDETVYTITLVRPAAPPEPDAVGPGPPRQLATRVPHLDTVAAPSEPAAPIPITSSTTSLTPTAISPSSLNGDASRSASFSSGYSVSSRKATNRPAVGPERRNLPLGPEFTSMLAHATGLVTGKGHSSPRRGEVERGPSPSTIPWTPADGTRTDGSSALEDKLPLSVSVLIGRTQSFDRGIEALSDGTDRAAGKPLPFRIPTRAERDALQASNDGDGDERDAMTQSPSPTAESEEEEEEARRVTAEETKPAPSLDGDAARRQTLTLHKLVDMVETVPTVSLPVYDAHPSEGFRLTCPHPPQILFMADLNGQITWLNKAWYDYTGADPAFNMTFEEWMCESTSFCSGSDRSRLTPTDDSHVPPGRPAGSPPDLPLGDADRQQLSGQVPHQAPRRLPPLAYLPGRSGARLERQHRELDGQRGGRARGHRGEARCAAGQGEDQGRLGRFRWGLLPSFFFP